MNLFQEQGVKDYVAVAAQIPVIDFGPCFAGEPGALERTAEVARHACENVGFFYALNHGVPDSVVERAFAASRRFHALPLEEKLKLRLNENNIGYLPINASVQGASTVHKATRPNQNESFFISHDRGPDHPDVIAGTPLRGGNQWPDGEPELRQDMMAYFQALGAMCDRILPVFATALDMPADFFAPFFADEAHANLRFLHYPPQPADEDNLFGQAPHIDNSFMTALARTDVPGLAVRLPSGEWFPPPIIPGTFLINLGNIMRRWSNDRFLSTPHGVLNDSGADRYSIAYFHSPNVDSVIECLPSCRQRRQPGALPAGGLSRSRARLLPGQLFSSERPPLRCGGDGRSGGGVASWRGDCFVAPLLAMTNFAVIASEAKQSPGYRGTNGGRGPCSSSTVLSRSAAPRCAKTRAIKRLAKSWRARCPTRPASLPGSASRAAPWSTRSIAATI
jgi:isopenicillin N synthase-like dioxygenase